VTADAPNYAPKGMKTFLTIWIGQLISMVGSGLTDFALGVWMYEQTGQATPFALTVLFSSLPRVLLAPIAGSLADRWNRKRIMILTDTASALVTLAVVVLLFSGQLAVWHIYLIALIHSIFGAFQEPAYRASVVMLVSKENLGRANGLAQAGHALEVLIAPLLAGGLLQVIGMRGIILIDFVTFFFAVGALLIVRIPQPEVTPSEAKSRAETVWNDARFGWRYLRERVGLLGLVLYFAMVNFLLNFAMVLLGPMILAFSSTSALGAAQMAGGLGMLGGSLLMSAWGGPKRRIHGVIGFIALVAVGLVVMGLYPSSLLIIAGAVLMMFSVPLASGASQAISQSKIDPAAQGRTSATTSMISRSMMPIAYLSAGPLADRVFEPMMREGGALANTFLGQIGGTGPGRGIGLLLVSSGLLLLVVTALAYANPRIRLIEDELPDYAQDEAGEAEQDMPLDAVPEPAD